MEVLIPSNRLETRINILYGDTNMTRLFLLIIQYIQILSHLVVFVPLIPPV